ncbi:MAG: hypothetical protein PVG09_09070, partial [Thiohalocapsa sp.]
MHFTPMRRLPFSPVSAFWLVLLAGCSGLLLRPDAADRPAAVPAGVAVGSGSIASATGCALDYRTYRPGVDAAERMDN